MPIFLTPDGLTPSDPSNPGAGYRDRDAFAAIIAALKSTNEFGSITFPGPIDPAAVGAGLQPLAVLVPGLFEESDDADAAMLLRRGSYHLILIVRDEDDANGYGRLDRLACLVQNVLDGSALGGGCLPSLTRLRQGGYDPRSHYPEQRLVLNGEFAYQVAKATGRSHLP